MQTRGLTNNYQNENIKEYMIPQESVSYIKTPIHIAGWQKYLKPSEYSVLTYLISRVHKKYHYAFPSLKTAAEECNISENTFTSAVKLLEKIGLILVDREGKSNRYYLSTPIEPNEEIIAKHIPKMLDKFKDCGSKKKSYQKVTPFTPAKTSVNTSSNEETPAKKSDWSAQKLRSKQNLQIQNLSKQHQKQETETSDVVDFSLVNELKSYGISHRKSLLLSKIIPDEFNLQDFNRFCQKNFSNNKPIENKAGFLIHALDNFTEDYLEYKKASQAKSKETSQDNEIKEQFSKLKSKIDIRSVSIYNELGATQKENLIDKVYKNYDLPKNYQFQDSTLVDMCIEELKKESMGEKYNLLTIPENQINNEHLEKLEDFLKNTTNSASRE